MTMNKYILFFIIISCVPIKFIFAQNDLNLELELSGYNYTKPVSFYMSEDDKKWLTQKKTIKVAVYQVEQSPLVQTIHTGRYRGMNADYLNLIEKSTNTNIRVTAWESKESAIRALKSGEVDMVMTDLESSSFVEDDTLASISLIRSWPNLVTTLSNVMSPLFSNQYSRIAIVNKFPDEKFIHQSFPNADIKNYTSYQEALNSVANKQNLWFFGDSLTTSIWLSQDFNLSLSTVKYWPTPKKESYLLLNKKETRLFNILNNIVNAIDDNTHGQIANSIVDKDNLSFLLEPVEFTIKEKNWIKENNTIHIIVNPWFAPYTMIDSSNEIRGVVGDILNIISLQTGLQFKAIIVKSNEKMVSELKKNNFPIMQVASYDFSREKSLFFTHPFITTQFVTVVRKDSEKEPMLHDGMNVAISVNHILLKKLKNKYQNVKWKEVDNSSIALNLVATGKVDAAVSNQLTTRYMSEHYYPNQFIWRPLEGEDPATISFAVSRSEPELLQILDKALNDIPQKEIFQIVSKWIRLPDVKINTWELYNKPFYMVAIFSTLLVVSSLFWTVSLAREVRQRKNSQLLLEIERNKAQQANQEKRDFLSHMSHEIRTPISAIMGFLELLQLSSEHFSPEDKVSVDQATQASRSLLKLIGEILDLEKIESGLLEKKPKWINIDSLINEKISLFNVLALKKGIKLHYELSSPKKVNVFLDPQLFGQVITNLIGNAIKFTDTGFVRVSSTLHNGELFVSVIDTGPGINIEEQKHLFNAFIQGETGKRHQGSGLGLAISRALMKEMGGDILIKSQINQGTTIVLNLPVKTSSDDVTISEEVSCPFTPFEGEVSVLIVDDHPSGRLLLQRQLATLGIFADEAVNGEAALSALKKIHYDILITDLNMPEMDGIELTRQVREFNSSIFILGMTASAEESERERCLNMGMNACLFKPLTLSQFSSFLSVICRQDDMMFDIKTLEILAQGNKELMLTALKDAQNENRRDLDSARQAAQNGDFLSVQHHIHRINGTAQILGVKRLMNAAQQLEEKLPVSVSGEELSVTLDVIETLLNEFEKKIINFSP